MYYVKSVYKIILIEKPIGFQAYFICVIMIKLHKEIPGLVPGIFTILKY